MHSDQTRKDGSSESMIQALYYDFVANYVKTRMYSTRYDAAGALRRPTSSQLVCTVRIMELLLCLQYFMRHNIVALHLRSCIREHSTYNYVGTSTNVYSCAFHLI